MKCVQCSFENIDRAKFCANCGQILATTPEATAEPTPTLNPTPAPVATSTPTPTPAQTPTPAPVATSTPTPTPAQTPTPTPVATPVQTTVPTPMPTPTARPQATPEALDATLSGARQTPAPINTPTMPSTPAQGAYIPPVTAQQPTPTTTPSGSYNAAPPVNRPTSGTYGQVPPVQQGGYQQPPQFNPQGGYAVPMAGQNIPAKKGLSGGVIALIIVLVIVFIGIIGTGVLIFIGMNLLGIGALAPDTYYTGTLEINNYGGPYNLGGEYEVTGHILEDTSGNMFFEVVDDGSVSSYTTYFLSMYCEIDGDKIVPIIGYEDAWVYDKYLTDDDLHELHIDHNNGTITVEYAYVYGGEEFDVYIELQEDAS